MLSGLGNVQNCSLHLVTISYNSDDMSFIYIHNILWWTST